VDGLEVAALGYGREVEDVVLGGVRGGAVVEDLGLPVGEERLESDGGLGVLGIVVERGFDGQVDLDVFLDTGDVASVGHGGHEADLGGHASGVPAEEVDVVWNAIRR
jgi:hypothetical protein